MAEQQQLMQLIFDKMPYLAWMKDLEGRYLQVNRSFAEFCGRAKEDILGRGVRDIFPGALGGAYEKLDAEVLAGPKSQFLDHVYKESPTGSKWFDTYVLPLLDGEGAAVGTIGFSRKISRRKQLEIKLDTQKRFLRTLMDSIPDIISYKDSGSTVVGCNKACLERFYGAASEEEVIGKTTGEILKDDSQAAYCMQKDQQVLANDRPLKSEERYALADGTVIDVETIKAPYHDEQGRVTGLIAISRDITERKKFAEELRRREEESRRELELAARVQRDTLPAPFAGVRVRVETLYLPYQTVSGDLFNYRWFDGENKLRGYVVDVSGHGVATALQTATIKMLLDTRLLAGRELEEGTFPFINQKMMQYLQEESFAAVLYFEFDFERALLTVVSGGINFFLAAKAGQCELVPVFSGFLGLFDQPDLQVVTRPLRAGETYCMMSDGVSDLIEMHGTRQQRGLAGYTRWLKGLAQSVERRDDFSTVNIELLQVGDEACFTCIESEAELAQAQRMIGDFLRRQAPECADMLEVAVNEALNNGLAAGGQAGVRLRRRGRRLVIRIRDCGPGFDTTELRDKLKHLRADEAFDALGLNVHGRGILLMHMFCDRLLYNLQGNEVMLVKNLAPAEEDPSWGFSI